MLRGDQLTATVALVRQASSLDELVDIDQRVRDEGIEGLAGSGAYEVAVRLKLSQLAGKEALGGA